MSELTGYIETTKIQPALEDLVITPSKEEQNFKSKVDGYDKVRVNGVPFETLKVEPTKNPQVFEGVYDKVEVEAITGDNLTITPSKKEQSFNGLYENVFVEKVTGDNLNITPTEEKQSFNGLYENVNVEAISTEEVTIDPNFSSQDTFEVIATEGKYITKATVNKDENLDPEVILEGNNIYGVDGAFKPLDTSDATATAEDVLKDKTAYVNGEKVVGTLEKNSYNARIATDFTMAKNYNLEAPERYIREMNVDDIDFTLWNTLANIFANYSYTQKITGTVDCKNITQLNRAFLGCTELEEAPTFINTGKVTYINAMFQSCSKLKKLCSMDASSVNSVASMLTGCYALEEFGGLLNLGKAFTSATANNSSYKLDLSSCTLLTHESLMNVINGLYDLNLTYNVVGGGTLATQSLILGSTNLAKLTADEIAIATNKGWVVS